MSDILGINSEEKMTKAKAYVVIVFFFTCLALLAFIFSKYFDNSSKSSVKVGKTASSLVDIESYSSLRDADLDSDGDGVPNWREMIYNTDPNVANSSFQAGLTTTEAKEIPDHNSNFTKLLARDLYVAGTYAKSNKNIDVAAINAQLSKSLVALLVPARIENVNIINAPTAVDYQLYFTLAGKLFKLFADNKSQDMEELTRIAQKEQTEFTYINSYYTKVASACEALKAARVPKDMRDRHIDLVLLCEQDLIYLDAFRTYKEDPVKVSSVLTVYAPTLNEGVKLFTAYQSKVKSMNITFADNSPANVFYEY